MNVEQELKRIFEIALMKEGISETDNLLELGGGSLPIIVITSMIRRGLHVDIAVSDLFHAPTVKRLAQLILSRKGPKEAQEGSTSGLPPAFSSAPQSKQGA